MADKINEKLLFPLINLQAQETVKDFWQRKVKPCRHAVYTAGVLQGSSLGHLQFFWQSQPHFIIERSHLVSQCLLCYKVNDNTIKCFMQGTVDNTQHRYFDIHTVHPWLISPFLNIANTSFCVPFQFSKT